MPTDNPDLDYKKDLQIDRFNLDLEWAKNPELFAKWFEKLIDAENHLDRTHDRLELKEAELSKVIRSNPDLYGLKENVTEKAIRATVISHPEYRELKEKYLKAKHHANILRIAVKSFKNREKAIDRETKLYLAKYYMKPYGREEEELVQPQEKEGIDPTSAATESLDAHMRIHRFGGRNRG